MIQKYVVGFMFSNDRTRVALIRKNKPAWQAGKLNGIGGKIEDGEHARYAMAREFREETGYDTSPLQWEQFCRMEGDDFQVYHFVAIGDLNQIGHPETEKPEVCFVKEINPMRRDVIENIPWLVSLALDFLDDSRPRFVTADYRQAQEKIDCPHCSYEISMPQLVNEGDTCPSCGKGITV